MSIFGTGFGQPNQQQQPQQQQNAFGQPSAFGGTGAGFGAFGQSQPQTNPMFGNLANNTSSPFGGGGTNTGTSAFGQPKLTGGFGGTQPATFGSTGGGFGSTATGTGGGFGTSGTTAGIFGQPATQQPQQTNAFSSSGSGLFGKPIGTGFGSSALTPAVPTTGSSNPPYQETQDRDQVGNVSTILHYQSISFMPAYRNASFEELRVQDYQQGRKTANAFGATAPTAFGQPAQQQPTAGLFGQPAASGAFGQQPSQTTGFGAFGQQQQPQQQQQHQPNAFGAFGQTQPSTGFGGFGQQNQQQQQQPAGSFGTFGQPQQQPQQPSTGFGAFGQQTQPNKGFGLFGQTQPNTAGFSAFGSNQPAGTGTGTGTNVFGQPQQQNSSSFGAFGQQTQPNQQSGNSLLKPSVFGQPSTGGGLFGNTGQQQSGGLFGQPAGQQQQQPQQGGGLFGQPSGTGAFGQPAQPQPAQQSNIFGQPASTGGGLFGNVAQQPQQNQQAPGSGFSSLFAKPSGGGLFGSSTSTQQNPQQNPNPANPLFSGTGSGGGGLFGTGNTQQQPSSTNPLFGGANTGSLFGGKPPAPSSGFGATGGGGLFGANNQQQQQQPSLGGGLFSGLGTQQQPQQQSFLFGASQQQHGQPTLTASIDQPLPSSGPPSIPPLPALAASLSPKKKSNVFADVAARSSPRIGLNLGINYTPPGPGSKLRGFGASATASSTLKNPFSIPAAASPSKGAPSSLLPSDAFSSGANGTLQLLGGARQSVKKLVLDKRVDEDELHRMRTASPERTPAREVRFSPALGVAARERDHERAAPSAPPPTATRPAPRPTTRLTDTSHVSPSSSSSKTPGTSDPAPPPSTATTVLDPKDGEYWSLPTVAELQRLSFSELQAVKDFTVGRVGYGTIQFIQPVDLTSVPSIADIPGKIVTFEHVECMLYPDERLKPPAGEGLNVPARIKLDRCWATDRSTREPIKDEKDPKHQQRLRKMKNHEGAEFVGFDMETGVWEFIVQEF